MNDFFCHSAGICGGCGWIQYSRDHQKDLKLEKLRAAFHQHVPSISLKDLGPGGIRERVDLIWNEGHLGFYDLSKNQILDIKECPQLTPALNDWLSEVRKIQWPIRKGSLRLRVNSKGEKGIWLDFSNLDVKALFDEENLLRDLLTKAVVEIGQRRKRLHFDSKLSLRDPEMHPWIQSQANGTTKDIWSSVGAFSQTGHLALKTMTETLESWLPDDCTEILEFGSGNGALTVALADRTANLKTYETDPLALLGLEKTLSVHGLLGKTEIHSKDYFRTPFTEWNQNQIVVMDPPRSGVGRLFDDMQKADRPMQILSVSCHFESFYNDVKQLEILGYTCREAIIVDQFPQTPHAEILSLFILSSAERHSRSQPHHAPVKSISTAKE